jgi:hypothetical protein
MKSRIEDNAITERKPHSEFEHETTEQQTGGEHEKFLVY